MLTAAIQSEPSLSFPVTSGLVGTPIGVNWAILRSARSIFLLPTGVLTDALWTDIEHRYVGGYYRKDMY